MKKSLLAIAIAAAVPAVASAQVTVGGIMDGGFNSVTTTNTPFTGSKAETTVNQTGGNAAGALASNRLFFRGTEKFGDMTAGFHYELGLDAGGTGNLQVGMTNNANGAPLSTAPSQGVRRSVVTLGGGFGMVEIGRDYTPIFSLSAATDTSMADNVNIGKSVYLNGAASVTTVRNNGQLMYTTPSMGGLTAKIAIVNRSQDPNTNGDVESIGGSLMYNAGPLMLGAAFNNQKTRSCTANTTATAHSQLIGFSASNAACDSTKPLTVTKRDETLFGATYTFNKDLSLQFQYGDLDQKAGTARTEYKGWQLGGRYNFTPNLMAHLSFGGGEHTLGDFTAAKAGLIYSLSKRSRLYWLSGADILEYKATTGTKERMRQEVAVGLNHAF